MHLIGEGIGHGLSMERGCVFKVVEGFPFFRTDGNGRHTRLSLRLRSIDTIGISTTIFGRQVAAYANGGKVPELNVMRPTMVVADIDEMAASASQDQAAQAAAPAAAASAADAPAAAAPVASAMTAARPFHARDATTGTDAAAATAAPAAARAAPVAARVAVVCRGQLCSVRELIFNGQCVLELYPLPNVLQQRVLCENPFVEQRFRDDPASLVDPAKKRFVLYYYYARYVWGITGFHNRIELPPCVIDAVRAAYPDPNGRYTGHRAAIEIDPGIHATAIFE